MYEKSLLEDFNSVSPKFPKMISQSNNRNAWGAWKEKDIAEFVPTTKSGVGSMPDLPPPSPKIKSTELSQEHLQLLDPLKSIWLFIIQPKVDDYGLVITDFFHPNTTHEISSDKRNLLLKGSFKRKLCLPLTKWSTAPQTRKINLSNLRGRKVATVEIESSALANEAIIACPPDSPRCRVIKYGGKYEAPTYSIADPESECSEIFSVENSPNNSLSSSILDYNIFKANNKLVGRVTSKSGLSFMLHISEGVSPLDKTILLGFVLAMDMLKQGKCRRKNNEYEYNE